MKVLLTQKMAGVAGSEQYLLTLIPKLVSNGVEAHFLVLQHPRDIERNAAFLEALAQAGATVHIANSRLPFGIGMLAPLKRLVQQYDYDVVQTNLIHADVWGAVLKSIWRPDLVLLSAKHGYSDDYQAKFGFDPSHIRLGAFAIATWFAAKKADAVLVISQGLMNLLTSSRLVDAGKCRVIPYGTNAPAVSADTQEIRYGTPQLLILGRLVAVKQHRLMIEILPRLLDEFPDLKLVIVGAGRLDAELRSLAQATGVAENIVWAGFQTNVHDYIRGSDALVLPSSAEGFGLVIIEAWMNAKPVVAFDVPAPNEIIDNGENGVLVRPFDCDELAARLLDLLRDPGAMENMGRRGLEKFNREYTTGQMISRTIALYRALSERGLPRTFETPASSV